MSNERLWRQVLLAAPTANNPDRPMTWWHGYISALAWSYLGVEPAELPEMVADREVFLVLLQLLVS